MELFTIVKISIKIVSPHKPKCYFKVVFSLVFYIKPRKIGANEREQETANKQGPQENHVTLKNANAAKKSMPCDSIC